MRIEHVMIVTFDFYIKRVIKKILFKKNYKKSENLIENKCYLENINY